ncbi:DEAD/DEAH box helicase [Pseudoalteromonas aurantia]|uniref:ATP-dependent helicase n=1 Tax=Pseudoalteromonas aurantia 208 TaxID=1314867 RepID=A0ABR9EFU2_9GAMM|nr:DEAD/DEAH box helicase [Pseudoalteromonas aurantia]MBE0369110.1 hypothetical protein [Pseudoalteromonas aurantia 208]
MHTLPIDKIKTDFLSTITHCDVIVSAATGSGKSTCLPIWASNIGKVLVIEPRRIACTSLAEYLALKSGQPLGSKIGYAIRFETHFNEQSDVVFVTPGVALRWFFEDKLSQFSVVMLDEFHERRWDIDLMLALLKQHKKHRLIITSATLNTKKLTDYLDAKLLHSDGIMYPVEEVFFTSNSNEMPSKDQLSERTVDACSYALKQTQGDILVFLPGKAEIQAAAAAAKKLNKLVVSLYGGCAKQQQELALKTQTEQRIIFSTNVAETSLTIPNISCVIDSGLERRTHLRAEKTVLALDTISKDSAKQRLGRAGRTQQGLCIRLYGEYAPLISSTPPEILRENLTELVLAASCSSHGIDSLEFIEALPLKSKQASVAILTSIGAIDLQGKATDLGKRLYPLPIDIELAYLINSMPNNSLKQAMIDIAALLTVPAKVYQLPRQQTLIESLNLQLPNACDLELAIGVVRGQVTDLIIECDALREAIQFSELLRSAFDLPELKYAASFNHSDLVEAIAYAKPNSVYIKRQNRRGAFGNGTIEVIPAKDSRISAQCHAMLVLNTYALAGKGTKQAMTLATLNAPFSTTLINKLNLGEHTLSHAELIDDIIMVNSIYSYSGVQISEKKLIPQGPALLNACCELILNDTLFSPIGQNIKNAIKYHILYNQANNIIEDLPLPDIYIYNKLESLGVNEQQDLELIEPADLAYHEIDSWVISPFIEKHPLIVQLNDLVMGVEYHFNAKRITLHYKLGKRKDLPKRWELPTWSGFSICYKKASKTVQVR